MAANSSVTGTTSALLEAAGYIARLPGLDTTTLTLLEGALLLLHGRDGMVSIRNTYSLVSSHLPKERVEAIFYTLAGVRGLVRQQRDRRGQDYDQYQVDTDHLRQIFRDAAFLKQWLIQVQAEPKPSAQTQLIATLPDNLPLDPETRRRIPSLSVTLHRLITSASQEIIILNPFFEQEGFNRLASALLAAAGRSVAIIIVSRQITDPMAVNYRVIKELFEQSQHQGVADKFCFYEYQQVENGRMILTSHAKMMVVDRQIAYIGSANLTEYGMARFVEIGITLTGSNASDLRVLMDAIINAVETKKIEGFL